MKIRNCSLYIFALVILLSSCRHTPAQTIPEDKLIIKSTEGAVLETPIATSSKISLPSGLILVAECYGDRGYCGSTLWLDNYDGEYRQLPFTGSQLRLSNNHQFAIFEHDGDIWVMRLEDGQIKNLTNTPKFYEDSVTWSPDDTAIAFLGSGDEGLDDIFIMDITSGGIENVTNTPSKYERCLGYSLCLFGWWSQQPLFIFSASGERKEVPLGAALNGQCHTFGGECTTFPFAVSIEDKAYISIDSINGVEYLPQLSPDGKTLAYDGGVLYDLKTGEQQIIYPSDYGLTVEESNEFGAPELVSPLWSPSGELIAWLGHTNNQGDIGLYVFDLVHDNGQLLASFTPYFVTLTLPAWQRWTNSLITWSPDGQWITLSGSEWGDAGENGFLWVFSSDGTMRTKIGVGDYQRCPPIWSPDSSKLVFVKQFYVNSDAPPSLHMLDVLDGEISEIDMPESWFIQPIGWFDS